MSTGNSSQAGVVGDTWRRGHTIPPGVIQSNDFVHERWICISPFLRFSDELWVASLACNVHSTLGRSPQRMECVEHLAAGQAQITSGEYR